VARRGPADVLVQACELVAHEDERALELRLVRRDVRPAARARGMRERHDRRPVELEPAADAVGEARVAEQSPQREPADRDDELRTHELELPVAPELAEILLARRRRPVAASRRCPPRVAAGHRRAEERRVEGRLVELEPAAERLAGAAPPRQPLLALDDPR